MRQFNVHTAVEAPTFLHSSLAAMKPMPVGVGGWHALASFLWCYRSAWVQRAQPQLSKSRCGREQREARLVMFVACMPACTRARSPTRAWRRRMQALTIQPACVAARDKNARGSRVAHHVGWGSCPYHHRGLLPAGEGQPLPGLCEHRFQHLNGYYDKERGGG